MSFKTALAATGNGLLLATTAIANAPIRTRLYEIDQEIEELLEEKAKLEKQLVK